MYENFSQQRQKTDKVSQDYLEQSDEERPIESIIGMFVERPRIYRVDAGYDANNTLQVS